MSSSLWAFQYILRAQMKWGSTPKLQHYETHLEDLEHVEPDVIVR